ncbi:MAG TPA: sigma-70 family RNA polymerase sigma factor [Gemmatimonadaceae bacterium]|nr:sigma-70 family RNA polymerase sigma factor [Gemmatimonadaceae bacterium]
MVLGREMGAGGKPDDAVQRAAAGDRGAFEHLYGRHVHHVFSICVRMTGDRQRAEELTQDVFVRAWEKLALFRGESAFSTWLHRLAVNVIRNARKTEGRERHRFGSDAERDGGDARDVEALPQRSSPEGGAHAERIDLERAIATLPPGARQVFVLHDVEGFTHEEIAEMLGVTAGGSKSQLHRARLLLRRRLHR